MFLLSFALINENTLGQTIQQANQTALTDNNFTSIRSQYISNLENQEFGSALDTFIISERPINIRDVGYGHYFEKSSNVFQPDESIYLYIEPVGFGYDTGFDRFGDELFQVNVTADIIMANNQGDMLFEFKDIPAALFTSKNKVTETFIVLEVQQRPPSEPGEYVIKYMLTDQVTGKSFEIIKPVRIANILL